MSPGANYTALQILSLQHSVKMTSSKQLCETENGSYDAHNAGEGYKKIAKRCQLALFTVWNVIKRWQFNGTAEIWKTKKTLGESCSYAGQKGKSKSPFDCKKPPGRFSRLRSGGALCSDDCTNKNFMEESAEETLTCILIIKSNVRSMQWNIHRSLMHFGNKCCGLMKLK